MKPLPLLLALALAGGIAHPPHAAAQDGSKPFAIPATDEGLPGEGPIRRYDWFKNLWEQKRSGWAKRAAQDQGALAFLGDSITQGWGDDLGGAFGETKVANRGISGDTTRGMLIRLHEDVLSLKPSGIVLLMGTNDLEEGAAPEVIAGNLKRILAEIKTHDPKLPVVLCQVFPAHASKRRPADQIKKINALYAEAAKGDKQITVVDTWTLFANAEGDAKKEEFPDLLHPNAAGYAKWAAAIRPVLETLGLVAAPADDFAPEAGFESLFNGKDLTGWGYRGKGGATAPEEVFDGKTESSDGRYVARNGRLIVTTPPEGRKLAQLWTNRDFPGDYVLKLEFRATPNADSGVFIRRTQLQCRDYLLAGPYKELKQYKPGDWNELVIDVKGGKARCTCNGEVLEDAFALPNDNGPLGLEGDRGQIEYRRLRVGK